MAESVEVHPRVMERHPDLAESDVLSAWRNAFASALRVALEKDLIVAVGFDRNGRAIEMVAAEDDDEILIFHAMTPPTNKTLAELRIIGR